MPSFLNKVFGYKKHDDKEAARPTREAVDSTLLDGKYEAIPPLVSPTGSTFAEVQRSKDPDREAGFSLFKPRTRGVSQKHAQRHSEDLPHLTLRLPGPKENSNSRSLGAVFEADPDSQIVLDDADIAAKRLNPLEALILVRACAQSITERGLETLGIMHPHWLSASADAQRRLISLFIRSLTQSRITTLSPTPTSPTSTFENELRYTRSPHDVAAVLRWGLRHLSLENGHFGKDGPEWGWYNAFFNADRNASYPPKAFSDLLLPNLPASHAELLTATLGLISSLASHAEANSISGSKLSKFLGLWLLAATRAERSDDWNRFYARWERSGRILEHLFLARLRDESVGLRLPTRLQELVQYYPYNKGSPATDVDLLSRPRFSTRQYDALFVRVETLLAHTAERPKQHPIQLLLEAFQLPVDNPSGDEHIVLWNTLKAEAFEEATSITEGPQFSRIFVDETIQLLSLIPADNSLPTSPTLLTSPITQVVSSEPSSSINQALEHAVSKLNANNLSTPASPTSPSSIVPTDWAQFTLSGFGDAPTAQPLAPLSNQDDDVEVTQPRLIRKSSRRRGKSRTRRRRSEEHEPLETPAQPDPEPPIVETKLASVHVVRIDEAFVDFWSDAIVDPISANWPTFVVCGLKQVASAQRAIRWLVIEQGYSRQEPQPSRVPSPDGRRGRSPRPSFKSDISGFRINTVFASARKRFSVFNKSATDLNIKRSGGKTLVAGELGELLVEEEPASPPAPPIQASVRVDGNGAVKATVTSGATTDVADQLKADLISSAPIADISPAPTLKEESGPVEPAANAPSTEPTPQSTGGYNGSASVLSATPVKPSEEITSIERDPPRTLDVISAKDNGSATPVTKIAPLAADTSDSRPTQGTSDSTILASGPPPSVENAVVQEAQIQDQQRAAVEVEDRPVEPVTQATDRDERLHAESTGEPPNVVQVDFTDNRPQEDAIAAVATSQTPEIIAVAAATPVVLSAVTVAAVVDEAPVPTVREPHGAKQPQQIASADPVAASSDESVTSDKIDHLSPVPAPEVLATETAAQREPSLRTSVANKVEEIKDVAELAEIPTPAPELVALVEETPGQEVSVDGHAGAARVSTAKSEALDSAAPQLEVIDDAASQPAVAELQASLEAEARSITRPVEAPCVDAALATDTSSAVETDHAADQVPELAAEEAQPHMQDTIVPAAEAPLAQAIPSPEDAADVSAGNVAASHSVDVASAEVEAQGAPESFFHEGRIEGTQDTVTPTPIPEHPALVDETSGPAAAADAHEPVEAVPAITPEFEIETQETVVGSVVEVTHLAEEEAQPSSEAELPAQVHDTQAAEVLSPGSNQEATTAALATVYAVVAVTVEVQSAPDAPAEDAEAHAPASENAPVEDTLEVANEASEPARSTVAEPKPIEDKAAAEPATHDVPAPIEPSSESAPQFVDEAAAAPTVAVPEEIIVVEVETEVELEVVYTTVDTVDDVQVEETEVVMSASDYEAPAAEPPAVEETVIVVNASEPEVFATEPAMVEVSAPAPVVEDVLAPVGTEESAPAAVEAPEGVVASQPDAAPSVEISETTKVDEPQQVVDHSEQPVTSETNVSAHEPARHSEEIMPAAP